MADAPKTMADLLDENAALRAANAVLRAALQAKENDPPLPAWADKDCIVRQYQRGTSRLLKQADDLRSDALEQRRRANAAEGRASSAQKRAEQAEAENAKLRADVARLRGVLSTSRDCIRAASGQLTKKNAKALRGEIWGWWYLEQIDAALREGGDNVSAPGDALEKGERG